MLECVTEIPGGDSGKGEGQSMEVDTAFSK